MSPHEEQCIRETTGRAFRYETKNALASNLDELVLAEYDAIIIGGSGDYSVHHPGCQSWVRPLLNVMQQAVEQNIPSFCICFGHQLLGVLMGSVVETDPERTEIGTVELTLTDAGKDDPIFGRIPDSFCAQTGHSDYVTQVPQGVTLLVQGGKIPTQAFKVNEKSCYSTQFHPDLTGAEAQRRYRAYQTKLQPANNDATDLFLLGKDESTQLLSHFGQFVQTTIPPPKRHQPNSTN